METLKKLLQIAIELIDKNEFIKLNNKDLEQLSILIHNPTTMSREEAAKFLGISLNKFHEYRTLGIIPEPRKRKGFKEKEYYLSDLSNCLETIQLRKC